MKEVAKCRIRLWPERERHTPRKGRSERHGMERETNMVNWKGRE